MLSVIIISKDEEENIRHCLESVSFADEIIVLDSGSSDNTVAIAKEYTDNVFSTDWLGYGVQKQRALSKATKEWVLNLDADESVSPELQQVLIEAISTDKADAYRIPIQMIFNNQLLHYSASPKRHVRLFRRDKAHYSQDIVHEKVLLSEGTRIGIIRKPIMHHSYQDLEHVLYKINRYSSYSAKIRIESNKKAGFGRTLLSTGWMFFRCYILQRGFLDGKLGFLFALFSAQGSFYRGMKQIYQDKNIHDLPPLTSVQENQS